MVSFFLLLFFTYFLFLFHSFLLKWCFLRCTKLVLFNELIRSYTKTLAMLLRQTLLPVVGRHFRARTAPRLRRSFMLAKQDYDKMQKDSVDEGEKYW